MKNKTIISVTGIRPDFIRMSNIFKKLDENFNHILIHSGQHFDKLLSDVFFEELNIRRPDYNLGVGGDKREHFHQNADLSIKLIELIHEKSKTIKSINVLNRKKFNENAAVALNINNLYEKF